MLVVKNRLWIVSAVAAGVVVSACSGQTTGNPTPTTSSSGSAPTSSASSNADPLAAVDPCSLISKALVTQNVLQQDPTPSVPGGRGCRWTRPDDGSTPNPSYTLDVDIYDTSGLSGMNTQGMQVSSNPIGNRPGRLLQDTTLGSCLLGIAVTSTSRVDIDANAAAGDITTSCKLVSEISQAVAPNLPPYSG
ncbi:MAG TPA: DUF3558 family protein [Pseudonocardiaceae bacterium]|jgi:hypothetical protein|nr:DUF3558 family protein [Pseudonocardiaceae bacterium]